MTEIISIIIALIVLLLIGTVATIRAMILFPKVVKSHGWKKCFSAYPYTAFPAATFASLIIAAIIGFNLMMRQWHLSFVPDGMGVSKILYVEEESWGFFGPGANETGIIVYELPDNAAKEIQKLGIDYFLRLPPPKTTNTDFNYWQGRYERWQTTPLSKNKDWAAKYMGQYGFGIRIDSDIENDISQFWDLGTNTKSQYWNFETEKYKNVNIGNPKCVSVWNTKIVVI